MKDRMLKITQIRSAIGCSYKHRATLRGLGLRRIGSTVKKIDTHSIRGMLNLVNYMIKVEYE